MTVSVHKEERWQRSPITDAIVQRLRSMKEGDLVHFSELSYVCHQEIDVNTSYFRSACNIVQKEYQMIVKPTGTRPYKTIVRLKNEEISDRSTQDHLRKLKSSTRKMTGEVDTVDISRLDRNGMNQYASAQAYAAMTNAITSKPLQKEIQRRSSQWEPDQLVDNNELMKALANVWKKPENK